MAKDRTALIVGAGQGMGRAIAMALAADRVEVHLAARDRSSLDAVAAQIESAGGRANVHPCDARDFAAVRELVALVGERIDIVVHTVGESMMRTFEDTTEADWQSTIAANLNSAFHVAHASLPALRASDNPSLVLVVSKTAVKGYPVVAYSAAKAGVLGMARALANELASEHIRVVPICPGPTDTPMRWEATPDMQRDWVMGVDNVARLVTFLVNLDRGTTADAIVLQADLYD